VGLVVREGLREPQGEGEVLTLTVEEEDCVMVLVPEGRREVVTEAQRVPLGVAERELLGDFGEGEEVGEGVGGGEAEGEGGAEAEPVARGEA
jgi:hypothetical protein